MMPCQIKFSALNETSSSDEDDGDGQVLATREAQEEEAYSLYNKALKLQSQGDISQSEDLFKQVLQKDFVFQAKPREEGEDGPLRPALTLKYLAYKNLAGIANDKKNYHSSMESYLEAMSIDSTDVSMWYRMGKVALNLPNYSLARLCFEEGLKCNPNHWPCLDNVITVMYALNDYANCLYYVAKALEKESCYLKGLTFKDQIYKEDPSLQSFCEGYFKNCNPSIHTTIYDKDEGYKFIQESLTMREKKRALYKSSALPILGLKYQIKEFTWKALGESLVHMYDYITTADPYISLGCRIDFSRYIDNGGKIQEIDCEKAVHSPATVSSSSEAFSTLSASPGSVPTSQSSQQQGGLLQLATPQQDDQDQQLLTGDNNVEMEVEDVPNGCAITLTPNIYTLTIPPTEVRALDPVIYSDAPLGNRRAPKRKRLLSDLQDLGGKRRSARVRNTSMKKPQDNVNYQELLQKFLPSSLLGDGKFDDPDDDSDALSQDKNNGDHTYGQAMDYSKRDDDNQEALQNNSLCATEKEDIHEFIISNQSNGGMLDLLYKYTVHLGSRSSLLWTKGLPDVYAAAFVRLRKHITLPNLFCHETGNKYIKEQGMALLVFSELKVDQWYLTTGHSSSMSPSFSRKVPVTSPLCQIGPEFLGKNFHADMDFLMQLTVRLDVLGSDWLEFTVRVLWLKAKFHSLEGEVDVAVNCMEKLTELLQKDGELALKITVANCSFSNVITLDHVQQQFESLQRCQSLEEVQKLYEVGDYQSVVELLVLTFNQPRAKSKLPLDGGIPERHAQLILLQDSLWKLESYQECVRWSEVSFNEAIQQYLNASSVATRSDWTETMTRLLSGLDRCIKMDKNVLNFLDEQKLVRLTQNLIGVICLQMENFDSELSLLAVLPWILLYRLIYNEEIKIKALAAKSKESTPNLQEHQIATATECLPLMSPKNSPSSTAAFNTDLCSGMPSSLMLLFTAHEYLGRRSWCCVSEGTLLLHCVDVMITELQTSTFGSLHPYKEDLEAGIEQCFYCLYGHPNKRTKAKHLQEHNVQQIPLTWERAVQIFQYFKPNILPEFDSYRTSTVSAELENLLKRISSLVQPEEDPSNKVDGYIAYIEGGTDKCPSLPPDHPPPSVVVRDLYYLLGDYYFKNKEFSKAIKFYLLDICVNPDRQDSWAGMALSRSSQLEQKLNSYELKNETTIYRKSSAALRCFEHALELDSTTTSLWIEYGSLAYVLHSHASRQLKQPKHDSSVDDIQELLRIKREEMLETAYQCFKAANHREEEGPEPEEAWLHHYMLGKIAEKRGNEPKIYLDHYNKALIHLHEDDARYPKKIQYHNPPELSIEALEVYYRIHASSLKYLMKSEDKGILQEALQILRSYLKDVAEGPFATFQENSRYESRYTSLSSSEAEELVIQPTLKTDKSPTDHDYYHDEVVPNGGALAAGICVRTNRFSVDSSSESQDSAAVKDVLNSIVSVVSEHFIDDDCQHDGPTIILGDKKIHKMRPVQENRNEKELLSSVTVETLDITALPCVSSLVSDSASDNIVIQHCGAINTGNVKNNSEEKDNVVDTIDELAELQKLAIELENQADSCKTAVSHSSENENDVSTIQTNSSVCKNVKDKFLITVGLDVSSDEKGKDECCIEKKEVKDVKLSEIIADTKIKREIIEDVVEVIDDMKTQISKLIKTEIITDIKKEFTTEDDEKRICQKQNEKVIVKTENISEEQNIEIASEMKPEITIVQMEVPENVVNEIITENEMKAALEVKMEIISEIEIESKSEKQVSVQEKIEVMDTFEDHNPVTSTLHCDDDSPPLLAPVSSEAPENDISMDPPTDLVRAGEEDHFLQSSKKLSEISESCKSEISENCKTEIEEVIQICLGSMRECLQRFIQHYKSLYRMAYYYCYSSRNKNLQWAREILLAATPSWKNYVAMPGLFAERKNTNFFNGIWRFPSNEIDRPGSFGAHMYRSVLLLIEVLRQQADYNMLLYLTQQLFRTPDLGKKYMRDTDRMHLAREAYDACVNVLREQMNTLLQEEPPPEEWRLTCCLLEIYRSCQTLLKAGMYIDETNELLEEAYSMYKIGEVDPHPSVLEQAIKFCQLQLGKPYQINQDGNRCLISSKQSFLPGDLQYEGNSTIVTTTSNCYTPDAWQREFAKSLMLPVVPFEERMKSDIQVVADSVLVIPVDNRSSQRNNADSGSSKQSGIQPPVPTQVVHVEKPRAENLRACSVAFLPVTSMFPTDKTAASSSMQKNAALLSCQTFECYDILTTLMQASGYHVASQTTVQGSEKSSADSSQSMTNKDLDLQNLSQLHNTDINLGYKRAWRKWPNKPLKQQPLLSFCAPASKTCMVENVDQNKRPIVQHLVKSTCLKGATDEKVESGNVQKEFQDSSSTKTYPKVINYSPAFQENK